MGITNEISEKVNVFMYLWNLNGWKHLYHCSAWFFFSVPQSFPSCLFLYKLLYAFQVLLSTIFVTGNSKGSI